MFVSSILAEKGNDVVSILASDTVAALAARLTERRIGAVVVCGPDGRISGIVSERDVVQALARRGAAALGGRVAELMVTNVETCEPDDTLEHVMQVMTARRIRHLPVMQRGRMTGIVSIGDVVKHLIAETKHEAEALRQYIAAG
jgi:CBS domain-containing protein